MQNLRDENDEIFEERAITYLGSKKLVFVAYGGATYTLRDYYYVNWSTRRAIRRAKPNTQLLGGPAKKNLAA